MANRDGGIYVDLINYEAFNGNIKGLKESIQDLSSAVKEFGKVIDNLDTALANGLRKSQGIADAVIDSFDKAVSSLSTKGGKEFSKEAEQLGDFFNQGLAEGLSDSSEAEKAAQGTAEAVKKTVKKWWGVRSPATEGIELGKFFIEGIAIGLEDDALWQRIMASLKKFTEGISEVLAKSFVKDLSEVLKAADKGLIESANRIANFFRVVTLAVERFQKSEKSDLGGSLDRFIDAVGKIKTALTALSSVDQKQVKDVQLTTYVLSGIVNVITLFSKVPPITIDFKALDIAITAISKAVSKLGGVKKPRNIEAVGESLDALRKLFIGLKEIEGSSDFSLTQSRFLEAFRGKGVSDAIKQMEPVIKFLVKALNHMQGLNVNPASLAAIGPAIKGLAEGFKELETFNATIKRTDFFIIIGKFRPLLSAFKFFGQAIRSFVKQIPDPAAAANAAEALSKIANAFTKFEDLRDIGKTSRDLLNASANIGKAIKQGLTQKIDTSGGSGIGKALGLGVIGGFKKVLGIASPSKVFIEYGDNIIAGLNTVKNAALRLGEDLGNSFIRGVRNIGSGISAAFKDVFLGSFRDTVNNMQQFTQNIGRDLLSTGQNLLVGGGIATFIQGQGVQMAAEFDQTLNQIRVFGELSEDALSEVQDKILAFSAATIFDPQQSAAAFLDLQKAGLDTAQALETLDVVGNLAAAGEVELSVATNTVVRAMQTFGLTTADSARIADLLVQAANSGTASVAGLSEGLDNVGPIANQFGLSIEETVAIISMFNDSGITGAEAGTQLRSMLTALTRPSKELTNTLNELGVSLTDNQGNFRSMNDIVSDLSKAMTETKTVTSTVMTQLSADQKALLEDAEKAWARTDQTLRLNQAGLANSSEATLAKNQQIKDNAEAIMADILGSQEVVGTFTQEITRSQEENFRAIQSLAGSFGQQGLAILLAQGEDGIAEYISTMQELPGAASIATEMMNTFKGAMDSLKGSIDTLIIKSLLPLMNKVLRPLIEVAIKVVNAIASLPEDILAMVAGFGLAAAAITTLVGAGALLLGSIILPLSVAFGALSGILTVVGALFLNPVGIVAGLVAFGGAAVIAIGFIVSIVGAIGAFIGTLYTLQQAFKTNENVREAFDNIKASVDNLISALGYLISTGVEFIGNLIGITSESTNSGEAFDSLATVMEGVASAINTVATGLREVALFLDVLTDVQDLREPQIETTSIDVTTQKLKDLQLAKEQLIATGEVDAAALGLNLEDSVSYVVQAGDTLSEIAKEYGMTVQELAELNNIENPNMIRSGQELMISGSKDVAKAIDDEIAKLEDLQKAGSEMDAMADMLYGTPLEKAEEPLSAFQRKFKELTQTNIFKSLFGDVSGTEQFFKVVEVLGLFEKSAINVGKAIGTVFGAFVDLITLDFKGFINGLSSGMTQILGNLVNVANSLLGLNISENFLTALMGGDVNSVAKMALDAAINIGKDIINGLITGMASTGLSILSTITGFVQDVKDYLGIASPSTLFYDIGVNIITGLINGIISVGDGVSSILESIVGGNFDLNEAVFGKQEQRLDYSRMELDSQQEPLVLTYNMELGAFVSPSGDSLSELDVMAGFNLAELMDSGALQQIEKDGETVAQLTLTMQDFADAVERVNDVSRSNPDSTRFADTATNLENMFLSSFTAEEARQEGLSFGENLGLGIMLGFNSLLGKIAYIPMFIIAIFKDLLGIASPSTVFKGFGQDLINGLILGLKEAPWVQEFLDIFVGPLGKMFLLFQAFLNPESLLNMAIGFVVLKAALWSIAKAVVVKAVVATFVSLAWVAAQAFIIGQALNQLRILIGAFVRSLQAGNFENLSEVFYSWADGLDFLAKIIGVTGFGGIANLVKYFASGLRQLIPIVEEFLNNLFFPVQEEALTGTQNLGQMIGNYFSKVFKSLREIFTNLFKDFWLLLRGKINVAQFFENFFNNIFEALNIGITASQAFKFLTDTVKFLFNFAKLIAAVGLLILGAISGLAYGLFSALMDNSSGIGKIFSQFLELVKPYAEDLLAFLTRVATVFYNFVQNLDSMDPIEIAKLLVVGGLEQVLILIDKLAPVGEKIRSIASAIIEPIKKIASGISTLASLIGVALTWVKDTIIQPFIDLIKGDFNEIGVIVEEYGIGPVLVTLGTGLAVVASQLITFGTSMVTASGAAAGIATSLASVVLTVLSFAASVAEALLFLLAFRSAVGALRGVIEVFAGLVQVFQGIKEGDPSKVLEGMVRQVVGFVTAFAGVGAAVLDTFGFLWERVGEITGIEAFSKLGEGMRWAASSIKDLFDSRKKIDGIVKSITGLVDLIGILGATFLDFLNRQKPGEFINTFIQGMFRGIRNLVIVRAMEIVAKDAINGLIKGFKDSVSSFIKYIGSFINDGIIGTFRKLLGIASPSTVFIEIGMDVIQGLINGFISLGGAIISTVLSLLGGLPSSVLQFLTDAFNFGINALQTIVTSAINAALNVAEFIRGLGIEDVKAAVLETVSAFFALLSGDVNPLKDLVMTAITNAFAIIEDITGLDLTFVQNAVLTAVSAFFSLLSGDTNPLKDLVMTAITNAFAIIEDITGLDLTFVQNAVLTAVSAFFSLLSGDTNPLKDLVMNAISAAFNIVEDITGLDLSSVKTSVLTAVTSIFDFAETAGDSLSAVADNIWQFIKNAFATAKDLIVPDDMLSLSSIKNTVKSAVTSIIPSVDDVGTIVPSAKIWSFLTGAFDAVVGLISFDSLPSITTITDSVISAITNLIPGLEEFDTATAAANIMGLLTSIFDGASTLLGDLTQNVSVTSLAETLTGAIDAILSPLDMLPTPEEALAGLRDLLTGIKSLFDEVDVGGILGTLGDIGKGIAGKLGGLLGGGDDKKDDGGAEAEVEAEVEAAVVQSLNFEFQLTPESETSIAAIGNQISTLIGAAIGSPEALVGVSTGIQALIDMVKNTFTLQFGIIGLSSFVTMLWGMALIGGLNLGMSIMSFSVQATLLLITTMLLSIETAISNFALVVISSMTQASSIFAAAASIFVTASAQVTTAMDAIGGAAAAAYLQIMMFINAIEAFNALGGMAAISAIANGAPGFIEAQGRATGGPTFKGQLYEVTEAGTPASVGELFTTKTGKQYFIPGVDGTVSPFSGSATMGAQSVDNSVSYNIVIHGTPGFTLDQAEATFRKVLAENNRNEQPVRQMRLKGTR